MIRNDALDRVLEGGASEFVQIAPNAMSYADDCLSQASFMSPIDAEEYAKSLELRGLTRSASPPDFVIVHSNDRSVEPSCDWLILFEFEQRLIATLCGNDSRTLIAPNMDEVYDAQSIRHYSAEDIARDFEFVERKENIDTYRNRETGELIYHTRTTESADEVFARAHEIVWQFRREPGASPRVSIEAESLREAIEDLQAIQSRYPKNAAVSLALGMAWFAVGEEKAARRQLQHAHELEPNNVGVLKELGGVCLHQGSFEDAVLVGTKAVEVNPDDPDLLGNLAVCQLLAGKVDIAKQTIEYATRLNAHDRINANLSKIISDVEAGSRPQPHSLLEMMQPKRHRRSSWLSRFFNRT